MNPMLEVFSIQSGREPAKLNLTLTENNLDEVSRQLPQGVYSTFRTFGACEKVLGLNAHLDRLYVPASEMRIQPSTSKGELRETMRQLLAPHRPRDAKVRISLSLNEAAQGQIFVAIEPLKLLDENVYRQGIKVISSSVSRTDPRLKSTSFISNSENQRLLLAKTGIFEALIVKNGRIFEGMTSNFYAVSAGKIITARYNILLGVTRRFVLRLARSAGIGIEYRSLRIDEVAGISEAFITSSSRGVVPVVSVDNIPIGKGSPGNVAPMLRHVYDAYVLDKAENI